MRGVRGESAEHPDRLLHRYDDYSKQEVQRDLLRDEQPVFGVKLPDLLRDEREHSLREFRPQTEESFAPASASIVGILCFHANSLAYN